MQLRFHLLLFLISFSLLSLSAQENLGLKVDKYAGVNSTLLNPANFLTSPFSWDINLAGAGLHFDNNFVFIHDSNLFDYINHAGGTRLATETSPAQLQDEERLLDFFNRNNSRFFLAQVDVMGPSFSIKLRDQFSIGIISRARAMVSGQNIPFEYSYTYLDEVSYSELIGLPPANIAALSWREVGLNLAVNAETYNGTIGIGATVKLLNGYEGGYLQSKGELRAIQLNRDSMLFDRPQLEGAYTVSNLNGETQGRTSNGDGWAFDLGFTLLVGEYEGGYDLKLGFALLDIGKINFDRNAEKHQISTDTFYVINYGAYENNFSPGHVISDNSLQALGDSTASLVANNFDVWLPGAFSLQADYILSDEMGINATLIQRIPFLRNVGVKRTNILAVTPRYDHRWYGASFPISLYNWKYLNLGAAFRLGLLTIGTDNLAGFVTRPKFSGADFYVALKFNPFDIGWNIGGGGGKKSAKCYSF